MATQFQLTAGFVRETASTRLREIRERKELLRQKFEAFYLKEKTWRGRRRWTDEQARDMADGRARFDVRNAVRVVEKLAIATFKLPRETIVLVDIDDMTWLCSHIPKPTPRDPERAPAT